MAPGRLQATTFFVTYSQSALTKEAVFDGLKALGPTKRVVVGHEHHQDGNAHFHGLVEFMRRKDVSPTHFDISGEHPNVKVWDREVTYEQWMINHWNYCFKEDPSPMQEGDPPNVSRKRTRDDCARECIEVARSLGLEKAQERATELFPSDYCKSVNGYDKIFLRAANESTDPPAQQLSAFRPEIVNAVPENWTSLFIWGKTRLGKTEFARALLPKAEVVRHKDQLKDCIWKNGVIFDDFSVSHYPPTTIIHLLDWTVRSGIDVKHGVAKIPPGTRKIFTYNGNLETWCRGTRDPKYDKYERMTDEQYEACEARIPYVLHVTSSLYARVNMPTPNPDPPSVSPREEWGSSIPE